ncbi:hypothetical protein EJB05_54272, partial [Eragrostis curvula]
MRTQASRMTATGFAVLLFDISASVGSDGLGLLTCFVGVIIAGTTLVAVGVRMAVTRRNPWQCCDRWCRALAAFVRRILPLQGSPWPHRPSRRSQEMLGPNSASAPLLCFCSGCPSSSLEFLQSNRCSCSVRKRKIINSRTPQGCCCYKHVPRRGGMIVVVKEMSVPGMDRLKEAATNENF